MKKKLLSILLALSLLLTLLPTVALAADGAWDGSIATAFAGGTGTEATPIRSPTAHSLHIWQARSTRGSRMKMPVLF